MVVITDSGHGGLDGGATANGIREAEFALEVSKLVAAGIRACGVHVRLTRTDDSTLLAAKRSELITQPASCVVSIHADAHTSTEARGHAVFGSAFFTPSLSLAWAISDELTERTPLPPRNPRVRTRTTADGLSDYYYVIRHPARASIPGVLVECGFVTNAEDAQYMRTFWGRFAIAYAISKGVLRWLGVPDISDLQGKVATANERPANIRALAAQEV